MSAATAKPKLAVWKFASCDGCQLSLLDLEDELLLLADSVRKGTARRSRRRSPAPGTRSRERPSRTRSRAACTRRTRCERGSARGAADRGCYGCYGPMETPNTRSLDQWSGLESPDLVRVYRTFNAAAPEFQAASEAHEHG